MPGAGMTKPPTSPPHSCAGGEFVPAAPPHREGIPDEIAGVVCRVWWMVCGFSVERYGANWWKRSSLSSAMRTRIVCFG